MRKKMIEETTAQLVADMQEQGELLKARARVTIRRLRDENLCEQPTHAALNSSFNSRYQS